MTNDGKIYIVITDKAPNQSQASISNNQIVNNTPTKQNDNLISHWARDRIISTITSSMTRATMYQLSNIGNFTGNYIAQTNINNGLQGINALKGIVMSGVAGFQVGNVMGALMGVSLSLINTGVGGLLNMNSLMVQNKQTNYEIAQLRDRAGLNALKDGSRGTEN